MLSNVLFSTVDEIQSCTARGRMMRIKVVRRIRRTNIVVVKTCVGTGRHCLLVALLRSGILFNLNQIFESVCISGACFGVFLFADAFFLGNVAFTFQSRTPVLTFRFKWPFLLRDAQKGRDQQQSKRDTQVPVHEEIGNRVAAEAQEAESGSRGRKAGLKPYLKLHGSYTLG